MERIEVFENEREVADFTLPIPENGTTRCVATLCWVPILRESIMCGSEMTWTVTRTIGLTQSQHEEFETLLKASLGVEFLEVVSKPRFGRLRGKDPLSERGGDESRADGRALRNCCRSRKRSPRAVDREPTTAP